MGTFFRRAGAYLIDLFIISAIVTLLSYLPILNPNRVQYSEKYNELVIVQEKLTNNDISMDEYKGAYIPIAYELYRLNWNSVVIDMVCVLLYFGVLQFIMKGQTIGKKLLQDRVVNKDGSDISLVSSIIRCVILSNLIITIALQLIVTFMNENNYFNYYNNVNLIGSVLLYITLFMVLVRQDGRGLHDFVAGTKVILTTKEEEMKNEKLIEEQKILESEYEIKKTEEEKEKTKKTEKKGTKKEKSKTTTKKGKTKTT